MMRPASQTRHALAALSCVLLALPACFSELPPAKADASAEVSSPDTGAILDANDPDAAAQPDTTLPDTPPLDVTAACPGGPGCTCTEAKDCDTGLCIATPTGQRCAKPCSTDCPDDFVCRAVTGSGGDITTVCVPRWLRLCDPCSASKACESLGLSDAVCIHQGAAGGFCGTSCKSGEPCPAGWSCKPVTSIEGAIGQSQCVRDPDPGGSGFGTCPCSALATQAGLQTTCTLESKDKDGKVIGTCKGKRSCTAKGLTACDAPPPGPDVCNLQDDDCDGQTDEGACDDTNACTTDSCKAGGDGKAACVHPATPGDCDADGNACTAGDSCQDGACKPGAVKVCDDGNPCTADACNPASGCTKTQDDGVPCDDGNPCTAAGSCKGGACAKGVEKDCATAQVCMVGACDLKTGDCAFGPAADGAGCNDGSACSGGDACAGGKCGGTAVSCDDGNGCTADACDPKTGCVQTPQAGTCSDGNACTTGEACQAGACGAGTAKVCADNEACTADSCDGKTGDCAFVGAPKDGIACDADGSVCTESDACAGGKCAAGKLKVCDDGDACTTDSCDAKGGCTAAVATGVSCSDGNACTVGDACGTGKDGKAACLAGKAAPCDDGNPCTVDSCDPAKGCATAVSTTPQPCYDGPVGSAGKGVCKGGTAQCEASGKPGACTGQVLPKPAEACNGQDDTCDGQTDEGCSPKAMTVRTGAWSLATVGTGTGMRAFAGGSAVLGPSKGSGPTGLTFGWRAWVQALWPKPGK